MQKNYLKYSIFIIVSILIFVVTLLIFIFDPTNSLKDEKENITKLFFADNISPAHRLLIQKFNEKYNGKIEVIPVDLPFTKFSTNERKELLTRALRSKSEKIDIFALDIIWVPRFAKWSEPLDKYFTIQEKNNIKEFALESCYFDSSLVAIPLYFDIGLLYYRKDIVRILPDHENIEKKLKNSISWEELLQLADRLHYKDKPFYLYQADEYEGLVCNYLEMLYNFGVPLFLNGKNQLKSDEAKKALEFMVDMIYKYRVTPKIVLQQKEIKSFEYAIQNDAVFIKKSWPGFIKENRSLFGENNKLKFIEKAALPHFKTHQSTSVYGGWDVMISKYSNKKTEALLFLKFLLTEDAQKILFEKGEYLPVIKNIYSDSNFVKTYPDLLYYEKLLSVGFHRPKLVDYTRISDILAHYINLALRRDMSVPNALKKASDLIDSNNPLNK